MATKERPRVSSDCQNWHNIFNAMVQMLRNQQTQLETLAKERKLLENRIRTQHDSWVSDVRFLEGQISQMEGNLLTQKMYRSLEAAKLELFIGLNEREAYLDKIRLHEADFEMDDFKALLDLMSNKLSDEEVGDSEKERMFLINAELENEVKWLKQELQKLALEKNSEGSAFLAEKQFVWNQYNVMEKDCTTKLNSKSSEVEAANKKVRLLIATNEQLQSLSTKKDDEIARLTSQVSALLAEKRFVWNQYDVMEKDCTTKLNIKSSEVEAANEKVQLLIASNEQLQSLSIKKDDEIARLTSQVAKMNEDCTTTLNIKSSEVEAANEKVQLLIASNEQLQSLSIKKDDEIARLTSQVAKMNDELNKSKEEIFRLSQELDSLRNSKSASVTPFLNGCTAGAGTHLRHNKSARDGSQVTVKKQSSALHIPDSIKGSRSSKRKVYDAISILETPKLFGSSFKIPKLK